MKGLADDAKAADRSVPNYCFTVFQIKYLHAQRHFHVNQRLLNKPELQRRGVSCEDTGGRVHCFSSFPSEIPAPSEEVNALFYFPVVLHCCCFFGSFAS